jgi:bacterioferritin (cytochrome b1)
MLAISGCAGRSHQPNVDTIPTAARSADVEILNGLIDREYKAIAAYTACIPLLAGREQTAAKQFLSQETTHAGELSGLITQAGGYANRARANYELGQPRSRKDVLELLHALEQEQIAGYVEAIAAVSPGSVRAALSAMLANDAQHIVVLRRTLHVEPLPSPFVTGAE